MIQFQVRYDENAGKKGAGDLPCISPVYHVRDSMRITTLPNVIQGGRAMPNGELVTEFLVHDNAGKFRYVNAIECVLYE